MDFRIFLRKKLTGNDSTNGGRVSTKPSYKRNRRLYDRYNVSQQHLTILNDQDILVIREISPKGFSSDVSHRAFQRFEVGDVYDARMRYLKEIHDLRIRVTWKRQKLVGFEIVNTSKDGIRFLSRLLRPIKLSHSLKEIKAEFISDLDGRKIWLHGDNETDLYIWYADSGNISAWRFSTQNEFVQWNGINGYTTGYLKPSPPTNSIDTLVKQDPVLIKDTEPEEARIQLALDVIMALDSNHKHPLLKTTSR